MATHDLPVLTGGKLAGTVVDVDTLTDGSTKKLMNSAERTKLAAIAAGATVNDTDANLRDRAGHTGTQSADTITDGTTNKAFTAAEKTKLSAVATGATANASDALLRDRSTHTGTQSADTLTDGATNKAFTATERTKLAGVATAATANASDAQLRDRSTHTGTQSVSTITGAASSADLAAHEADTTAVHGIADTSLLRVFPPAVLIDSMGTPMRTAHRTGGSANGSVVVGPVPENSLEGARVIVEAATALNISNFVLNVQCRLLADGTVGVIHDGTVDRTTTSTGNTADYNAQAWAGLVMDAGAYTGATAFGNLKMPLLEDFLREFGGRVALNIAAYQGVAGIGQAVVNKIVRAGLQKTVVISSFQSAELFAAKTAGIACMFYPPGEGNTGSTAAELLAANLWPAGQPKYVGVSIDSTDAYLQSLVTAGLHVSVYFTDRRWERERVLALGVQGLISDDPIYQFTDSRLYTGTQDPYTLGAWPHGHLESDASHGRGVLTSAGLKLDNITNTQYCVDGSRCPIATPTAYTMTGQLTFDVMGTDTTRSAQLILCCPDDRPTSGVPNSAAGLPDGYSLLFRGNGNVELYRNTFVGQGNTKVGSTLSTTAATAGVAIPFTVQVTSSSIIFTRTDTAATVTWADATHRGGYYHRGKNGGASTTNLGVTWKITSIA
jgi:hypothetical protein